MYLFSLPPISIESKSLSPWVSDRYIDCLWIDSYKEYCIFLLETFWHPVIFLSLSDTCCYPTCLLGSQECLSSFLPYFFLRISINRCDQFWGRILCQCFIAGIKERLPVEEMARADLWRLLNKTQCCLAPMPYWESNQLWSRQGAILTDGQKCSQDTR